MNKHHNLLHKYICTNNNIDFKKQAIYGSSARDRLQGVEVLIDFDRLIDTRFQFQANPEEFLAKASEALVSKLAQAKSPTQLVNLSVDYVFINLERQNLCNQLLIDQVCYVSKQLRQLQIHLVVELTERNPCGKCQFISDAIKRLQSEQVKLAIDDFDLYGSDFRHNEVESHLFDFIKVNMPTSPRELASLQSFCKHRPERIIVERIETQDQVNSLKSCVEHLWGYQGYHFDSGSRLNF